MKNILLLMLSTLTVAAMQNAQGASFERQLTDLQRQMVTVPAVSAPHTAGTAAAPKASAQREWLVLVFINGVNDLGLLGAADNNINDMERVGSTEGMAVVVEYGILGQDNSSARNLLFQRGSKTLYITRDADPGAITSPVINASDYQDMGSAASLVRFVKRGMRLYPAKKTAVILWNHGAGRLGISYDDVSRSHMEVDQLGRALGQVKEALGRKIDVFASDACFMQMASVAYEFRNYAEVVVGSEEIISPRGFPYQAFLGQLAASPGMGAEELGRIMVDAYGVYYEHEAVTLSAVRSSAMDGFVALLNNWLGALTADPQAFKAASSPAVVAAVAKFPALSRSAESRDLYDYIAGVNSRLTNSPAAKEAGVALQNYMKRALIVRATALPAVPRAHGLAIYIPALRYDSPNYEKLAFAADSDWDDFLRLMMEERLKQP